MLRDKNLLGRTDRVIASLCEDELSSLQFFVVLNVVGCVVVVVLSVVFRRQALEIPLPCAGGGHFVTRIPLRLVLRWSRSRSTADHWEA